MKKRVHLKHVPEYQEKGFGSYARDWFDAAVRKGKVNASTLVELLGACAEPVVAHLSLSEGPPAPYGTHAIFPVSIAKAEVSGTVSLALWWGTRSGSRVACCVVVRSAEILFLQPGRDHTTYFFRNGTVVSK
jgi:hypothetical protein